MIISYIDNFMKLMNYKLLFGDFWHNMSIVLLRHIEFNVIIKLSDVLII